MQFNGDVRLMRQLACCYLAAVALGCGGESHNGAASPKGGCANQETCADPGGSGGLATSCTDAALTPDPAHRWANWPMPNDQTGDLPNRASYDTTRSEVATDKLTGLMWERLASPVDEDLTFEAAAKRCGELELAGYCDWRLPTRIELVTLVDFTRKQPATDQQAFADFPSPSASKGWSFFTSSSREDREWRVEFLSGTSTPVQRSAALQGARARCVRVQVAQDVAEPRYLVKGQAPQDIVTDQGTRLVWQRRPSQQSYTLSEAQAYCKNLDLVGGGWRLPSMKEIQTIVDETRQSPAIDQDVFSDLPQGMTAGAAFRTSSLSAELPDLAWLMGPDGALFYSRIDTGVDAHHFLRCVR